MDINQNLVKNEYKKSAAPAPVAAEEDSELVNLRPFVPPVAKTYFPQTRSDD